MSTFTLSCPCSSPEPGRREGTGPLEGLVKKALRQLGGSEHISEEAIARVWAEAAGRRASLHTRPQSFKKSVLVVNVDGSSWLYELTMRKKEILKELEERLKGKKLKDIRFRIGEIK